MESKKQVLNTRWIPVFESRGNGGNKTKVFVLGVTGLLFLVSLPERIPEVSAEMRNKLSYGSVVVKL